MGELRTTRVTLLLLLLSFSVAGLLILAVLAGA
jgi:hypothetical protein